MKRYDSYKDSGVEWIGEIPSHWKLMSNKYFTQSQKNKSETGEEELLSVSEHHGIIPRRDIRVGEEHLTRSESLEGYLKVNKGELVSNIMLMWKRGLGVSEFEGIVSPSYSVFSFQNSYSRYFHYLFRTDQYVSEFRRNSTGIIDSRLRLYDDSFGSLKSHFPPLSEQQQIVSFLDTKTPLFDSLIEKTQRKIELLKEKKTSLINEVVSKGLNPNVEMKDSGVEWIGEIPSHYQMISIKFLVTTPVTDGPHETPVFIDEGIPFLSVNGVVGNSIDFKKVRGYISEELHLQYSIKCKPQRDDVLLVKSGSTTGKSTIVETDLDFNIWSPLCIIRSNTNKIIPRFTFHTFQSGYFIELIENNWSYGTQPNIGMNVIENLSIVVPPISEQQQIVEYLDEQTQLIDNTISIEEKRIELLKEYRQSLISEVVTGKRKVVE
jgi:type I restriction enzyme, S subunit